MYYHIMALVTELISVWLRYEVKYNMLVVKTEGVWSVTPLYMVA